MRYRHLRRTALAASAAVACLVIVAALAVRLAESAAVTRRVVRWVEQVAGAAVGGRVAIGELGWQFMPPRLVVRDVTVEAPGVAARLERASVALSAFQLVRRTLVVDSLEVDGLHLDLTRPIPAQSSSGGGGWVRFRVGQADLRRITVAGAELPHDLGLGVRGLDASWTTRRGPPRGFVRASRVELKVPGLEPVAVAVEARAIADGDLELPRWRLRGRGLDLEGHGRLSRGGGSRLTGEGSLDLAELDRVVHAGGVLEGRSTVAVTLAVADALRLDAHVRSPSLSAAGFRLGDVSGTVTLAEGRLLGRLDGATFCGGRVSGSYILGHLGPPYPHRVEVTGGGLALARLLAAIGVPAAGLSAAVEAHATLQWNGLGLPQGRGRASAQMVRAPGPLQVAGTLDVELTGDGVLRFSGRQLSIGDSIVTWQGPLRLGDWEPAWSIRAEPGVLEQIIPLVNRWLGSEVLPGSIRGRGVLQVTLTGPWRQLAVNVRLDAHPVAYPPMVLDRLVCEATIADQKVVFGPTRFGIGGGSGEVEGRITWAEGAGDDQLDLLIRADDVPVDTVASWIDESGVAEGTASFTGRLSGPIASPRGSWALALSDVALAGHSLGSGSSAVDLAEGVFTARALAFAGGLEGTASWAVHENSVSGQLRWPGMTLADFGSAATALVGERADARLDFTLSGSGPAAGVLELSTDDGATLEVTADPTGVEGRLTLADAASASVRLERREDGGLEGDGEIVVPEVARLVARLDPEAGVPLSGVARISGHVTWPPDAAPQIAGRLETLNLKLEDRPVHLIEPAAFTVTSDGFSTAGLRLELLDDEVFVRGAVTADGHVSGNVSGTIDLLLLRFLLPEWEGAGRATGVVELLGTVDRPHLEGIAKVSQVSFRIPGGREVVSSIDGTVLFSQDEIGLEGMTFRFMRGTGSGGGRIGFAGDVPDLNLAGTIANLEYPLFPGLEPRLGGRFRLEGPVDGLELSGELEVRQATLRRKDDLATIIADWFLASSPPAEEGGLKLDLRIEADRTLEARTGFIRVVGSASLAVTGTSNHPEVTGTVEFLEGGDFTFQGVRYELDRAVVTFTDPTRLNPFLDIVARAWIDTYQLEVRLTGTVDRLVPVVTSDPPLPENELMTMLAFGRSGSGLGGASLGMGVASSLLARELNSELERRTRELLPIDQLRVDPFAEASTGNPTARVTVVKQLSPNWSLMLQSNLSANREEVVVLRWFLGQGVFLEATRDVDGSVGLDLKLRRRY